MVTIDASLDELTGATIIITTTIDRFEFETIATSGDLLQQLGVGCRHLVQDLAHQGQRVRPAGGRQPKCASSARAIVQSENKEEMWSLVQKTQTKCGDDD
jgi:hypothetical protein